MNKVEKGMQGFLKLIEADMYQDPATAGDASTVAGETSPPTATAGNTQTELSPIQHAQSDIKFLSTLTMFTGANPPDSDTWENENNPQYVPLKDGRLVTTITKMFPEFKVKSGNAARYADNQFRLILKGLLRAPTRIEIVATSIKRREEEPVREQSRYSNKILGEQRKSPIQGSVEVYLRDMKINNKTAELPIKGEEGILKTFQTDEEKKIPLKYVDLSTLMQWTGITPKEEPAQEKEEKPEPTEKKKQPGFGAKGAESKKETKEEKPENNPHFKDLVKTAITFGFTKGTEANDAVKKAMKNEKVKTDKDIVRIISKLGKSSGAYEKQPKTVHKEDKDIYFRSYFRMLLEAQNSEDLEAGEGGEILNNINETIFDSWFKGKGGIAAPTKRRIFVSNMYEWFAAESAIFKPQKRTVDRVRENRSINITLEGQLLMEVEIWVDLRLMGSALSDQWNFYMLSGGVGKRVGSQSYKTPGSLRRGIKSKLGPKPTLQQQASINPQL